jgi:hypothetical protein
MLMVMSMKLFHVVEMPFERIFYVQGIQKSDFEEVVGDVISSQMALRNHNLPSGRLKKRLWCRKVIRTFSAT